MAKGLLNLTFKTSATLLSRLFERSFNKINALELLAIITLQHLALFSRNLRFLLLNLSHWRRGGGGGTRGFDDNEEDNQSRSTRQLIRQPVRILRRKEGRTRGRGKEERRLATEGSYKGARQQLY